MPNPAATAHDELTYNVPERRIDEFRASLWADLSATQPACVENLRTTVTARTSMGRTNASDTVDALMYASRARDPGSKKAELNRSFFVAVDRWMSHDGSRFDDREAAWRWMFMAGVEAGAAGLSGLPTEVQAERVRCAQIALAEAEIAREGLTTVREGGDAEKTLKARVDVAMRIEQEIRQGNPRG